MYNILRFFYKYVNFLQRRVLSKLARANIKSLPHLREHRKPRLIVSLTSFPQRMHTLDIGLYSIFNQSLLPDKVVLCLSLKEFPNRELDVPKRVLQFKNHGLEILFCEKNERAYKKLIPALKTYPDDIIVTVDDDIYYPKNTLRSLYQAYKKAPTFSHSHRAQRVTYDENNNLASYAIWPLIYNGKKLKPSFLNFSTGAGSVLYPPHSFHKDIFNNDIYLKQCPFNDDIWFWTMLVLNNVKINIVDNNKARLIDLGADENWDHLWHINCLHNKNDEQIQNILAYYPTLKPILDAEREI